MTNEEDARHKFPMRKRAFENKTKAEEAVRKAVEAKHDAAIMRRLTAEVLVILGGQIYKAEGRDEDSEELATLKKTYEKHERSLAKFEEEWTRANTEEQETLAQLAQASEELEEVTVEPRVEGSKLSFEVHKLRATVSAASLVGIAAVSGLVLPSGPRFIPVLILSFGCLLTSLVLSLGIMERIGKRVEEALISGGEAEDKGVRAWIARWAFPTGIGVFLLFIVLNFVTNV